MNRIFHGSASSAVIIYIYINRAFEKNIYLCVFYIDLFLVKYKINKEIL